ncbi:hypothetical protein SAMN05443507_1362 [Alicyclobacillus tolerans]|uniref:Uncharacterized protein n=1 Tax=Alicyclobacillus tolerans TaxID=90970 RepID=A0A1M6XPD6_9BACL|nr:hypothetical protein SAMN05443507_1362 [Alicyclobacillus montanus]
MAGRQGLQDPPHHPSGAELAVGRTATQPTKGTPQSYGEKSGVRPINTEGSVKGFRQVCRNRFA